MRKCIDITLRYMLSTFNKIIPKKNIILFNSFPAYCDNSWELYVYILNNRPDIIERFDIYWGVNDTESLPKYAAGIPVNVLNKKSFMGIWYFFWAKYIFTTHGYFGGIKASHNQSIVNLWHGCGYKTISQAERTFVGNYNIVTSEVYRKIHKDVFNLKENQIFITGLPRNDLFFDKKDALALLGINKSDYKKILIWMPTYRKAAFGHDGIDGDKKSFGLASLTKDDYEVLNKILLKNHILLIIKPHPMDSLNLKNIDQLSNIISFTTDDLLNKGIKLYSVLKDTDGLLSDYSSVIVDYLILDKPIAMVLSDAEEYKKSRGFVFEDVKEYFPGPVISNTSEFVRYIERFDDVNEKWIDKRKSITKAFHKYIDNKNCQRVCDIFFPR